MCLFWLALKAAPVNKKHRYVLCYRRTETRKKKMRCWAGKKRGGENPRKGRRTGEANVWQDLCAGVKASGGRTAHSEQPFLLPELSPVTLAGCSLGWLLLHHVLFSWWLACCLPLGLCSPFCWLLQYSFSLLSLGFDAYVLKVATVTLGGSRW